jgi:hypothetical protein
VVNTRPSTKGTISLSFMTSSLLLKRDYSEL